MWGSLAVKILPSPSAASALVHLPSFIRCTSRRRSWESRFLSEYTSNSATATSSGLVDHSSFCTTGTTKSVEAVMGLPLPNPPQNGCGLRSALRRSRRAPLDRLGNSLANCVFNNSKEMSSSLLLTKFSSLEHSWAVHLTRFCNGSSSRSAFKILGELGTYFASASFFSQK